MTKRARNLEAERAQQREYYRRHRKARCRYQAKHRLKQAKHPDAPPLPANWTIVAELGERDGIEYAKCRCAQGHLAVIAVDVQPQPECVKCLASRKERT
jgi:hypothetical protein